MDDRWRCTYCETTNASSDARCVVCDHARADGPGAVGTSGADSEAPTATFDLGAADLAGTAARSHPGGSGRGERGALVWILVATGAMALVLVVVIAILIVRRPAEPGTTADLAGASDISAGTASTTTSTSSSTTSTQRASTTVITTPPSTSPPTTAPVPTTPVPTTLMPTTVTPSAVAPRGGGSGAEPREGSWTTIFISCDDQAACARAAQEFRSFAPSATLIAPGTYRSLRWFWIVAAGAYDDSQEAVAFCRAVGRTDPDLCFARFLSQDPADVAKIVYP